MRNAKGVHFWQVDHKIKNISEVPGNIILSSPQAWQKFEWVKKYFERKPREGYFIWIKKEVDFPLATCINIASPKISQDLTNLLVIEKGIKVKPMWSAQLLKIIYVGLIRLKVNSYLKAEVH